MNCGGWDTMQLTTDTSDQLSVTGRAQSREAGKCSGVGDTITSSVSCEHHARQWLSLLHHIINTVT